MPLLLLDDSSDSDSLLLMVMMNSMTGGLNSQSGFDSNFNMLLPLLMSDCADSDADCKKKQKNMMVMMMAMQSQVKLDILCRVLKLLYNSKSISITTIIIRHPTPKWVPTRCSRCS